MDTLFQNIRYAIRALAKTPGFTLVAILTLALGIGGNSSVFSLVNAALFRPIPVDHPDELVWLAGTRGPGQRNRSVSFNRHLSYPEYLDYAKGLTSLQSLMAYQDIPLALGSGGEPQRVNGLITSGTYWQVLGLRPSAGRLFSPEDDTQGAAPAVVLSHGIWQRRFSGDRDLIGRAITVNGQRFTVVGVGPAGFIGTELGSPVDLWVTFSSAALAMPGQERLITSRHAGWLRAIGRLKAGATLEQADAEAQMVAGQLATAYPDALESAGARINPIAGGLDPGNRQEALPIFILLMMVPLLVLLIACANVANLMLARAAARRREVGIRLALGATRWRLVSQLLTEALVLTLVAGAAGLLLSFWLTDVLVAVSGVPPEIALALTPDKRVLAFTAAVSLLTGVFFGLVPALGASRPDLVPALKDEGGGLGRQVRRSRLVSSFVVAQVALSLVLLVTAGLFLRSLGKALRVDPGLDATNAVAVSFDLGIQGYDAPRRSAFYARLLERVRGLSGVEAASLISPMPLSGTMVGTEVAAEGADPDAAGLSVNTSSVWPGSFAAMGTPLVRGRDFTYADGPGAPLVVIVNETLARRLWPDQDAIGKRLRMPWGEEPYREVVGIARDAKYDELIEDPRPYLYFPERQHSDMSRITLVARATGNPAPLIPALSGVLHELDRNLPLFGIVTLEEALWQRLDKQRGASSVLGVFGGLALLLAALGLYGVMAYAVAQRTREVGVRMALGAASRQVLRQFVAEGLRLAAFGVVIGMVLAFALTRVIAQFLYGVTATDALTFVLCAGVLGAVAALASFVPARRASKVDPMVALRYE